MNLWSSGQPKNDAKTNFFHPPSLFHGNFCNWNSIGFVLLRNSRFNFHCYTQCEATPTQKSAQKCAATSRDFLCERLQSAFTPANQLRWIAQYNDCARPFSNWNWTMVSEEYLLQADPHVIPVWVFLAPSRVPWIPPTSCSANPPTARPFWRCEWAGTAEQRKHTACTMVLTMWMSWHS